MNTPPKRKILLAEDDSDDVYFFVDFLGDRADISLLPSVTNGVDVLDYLNNAEADADLPDVIMLDQNMPRLSGKETLEAIKSTVRYSDIIVVIYSTYVGPQLTDECLKLGATLVETKPVTRDGYNQMIDTVLSKLGLLSPKHPNHLTTP